MAATLGVLLGGTGPTIVNSILIRHDEYIDDADHTLDETKDQFACDAPCGGRLLECHSHGLRMVTHVDPDHRVRGEKEQMLIAQDIVPIIAPSNWASLRKTQRGSGDANIRV